MSNYKAVSLPVLQFNPNVAAIVINLKIWQPKKGEKLSFVVTLEKVFPIGSSSL